MQPRGLNAHKLANALGVDLHRHHRGMLVLSRSTNEGSLFAWLQAVQLVAVDMINRGAPANLWCPPQDVSNALDAAAGIVFLSACIQKQI